MFSNCTLKFFLPNFYRKNCLKITFPEESSPSVMSDWDLICDRAWMGPTIMSMFMAGVMAGAIFLGSMADKLGRRKTLSLTFSSLLIANLAGAYATSYIVYAFIRFLCGFFQSGVILASFVLMNEMVGSSKRALIGVMTQMFFAIGIMLLSYVSFYIRAWRTLTKYITIAGIPFALLNMFYVPESPRWLKSIGNIKEALNILRHITLKNGNITRWKEDSSSLINKKKDSKDVSDTCARTSKTNSDSVMDLMRHPMLLQLTIIQLFSWFVNGATYYGLTLAAGSGGENGFNNSTSTQPDIYTSTTMSGLIELPAYVVAVPLLNSYGRRKTLVMFMIVGGIACLMISAAEKLAALSKHEISSYLALIGKLCISASFSVVYIHSNEIFPTTIRNSAMGLVSFATRIGGITAPFLAKLGQLWPNMHFVIFGGMTLLSGFLNLRLPETKDVSLPEDIENLIKIQSSTSNVMIQPTTRKSNSKHYHKVMIDEFSQGSVEDL